MSHRIIISSFAAIAIGMSCIGDASAGGYFGAPGFRPMPRMGGFAGGGGYGYRPMPGRMGGFAGGGYWRPGVIGVGGPTAGGSYSAPRTGRRGAARSVFGPSAATATGVAYPPSFLGSGVPTGGGAAAGTLYYEPTSYVSNAACGHYPYPPCREPAKAKSKKKPAVEPDD
jgi:hypothetical protein